MKKVTIGIDIGGTNTVFGLVDINGEIIAEGGIPTQDYETVEPYIEALVGEIKSCLAKTEEVELKGIGVGAPNGNYYNGKIEYAPNLKWGFTEVPLVELMQKHFDVPVFLTNDANAAAIGEMVFGAAKDIKDFVFITLGTGLGSGIVANGEMIYGHDGFAGEVGHTIVVPNGRECGCGRKGCLETYASATGIRRTVAEILGNSMKKSKLRDIPFNELTSKMIYDAAKEGDEVALEAFEKTAKLLGFSLANTVAYTSPKAIFLFGGLANAGDILFKPTKKYMEENILKVYQNKVKVLPSGLSSNAAIIGSSALAWNEIK